MSSNSSHAVLHGCPGALSLPSIDPHALAMETLLRLCHVRFTKVHAPATRLRVEASTAGEDGDRVTYTTLDDLCKGLLSAESPSHGIAPDAWDSEQRLTHTCAQTLALHRVFPAFTFLIHYDVGVYDDVIATNVVPHVGTLSERLTGSYRMHTLRRNCFFHCVDAHTTNEESITWLSRPKKGVYSPASLTRLMTVVREVESSMQLLESLYERHHPLCNGNNTDSNSNNDNNHNSSSSDDNSEDNFFFLGTAQPTHADACVYAAVSCVIHADWSHAPNVCPSVPAMQQRVRTSCPRVLRYAERLRHLLYDDYRGWYTLQPVAKSTQAEAPVGGGVPDAAVADLYARGRRTALLSTALFACVYGVMANVVPLCNALLLLMESEGEAVPGEDKEEDEA